VRLKISIDHISALAHLKSKKEERRLLVRRMIKIAEWVEKLGKFFKESRLFKLAFLFEKCKI
jgi:Asp-tRNA(Asn)/Glu-tRNA(Gln) amidotransferase C subunit